MVTKVALVIGGSRGIGRQISKTLAKNGYCVGVAAKTEVSTDKLPGSIHTVVKEIQQDGGQAIPIVCNVRREDNIKNAVNNCLEKYEKLDVAIYNAGAITWDKVQATPLKRYDLMHEVNARGAYCMVQNVLPHFLDNKTGRILLVAPPIYNRFFKGKTPYSMTKVAMTVLVHGLANELKDTGVSISALWPATTIQSHVTDVMGVPTTHMRNADIFAEATLRIVQEQSEKLNGKALIDEDYLRTTGVTDFEHYRCDPKYEPPRIMPKQLPSLLVEEEDKVMTLSKL